MTLRQAVTRRVKFTAGLIDQAALLIKLADKVGPNTLLTSEFELTFTVESKAEADKIIDRFAPAARALWRNGVYMAEVDPAKLPRPDDWWYAAIPPVPQSDDGKPDRASVTIEMHFVPSIIEQAT